MFYFFQLAPPIFPDSNIWSKLLRYGIFIAAGANIIMFDCSFNFHVVVGIYVFFRNILYVSCNFGPCTRTYLASLRKDNVKQLPNK